MEEVRETRSSFSLLLLLFSQELIASFFSDNFPLKCFLFRQSRFALQHQISSKLFLFFSAILFRQLGGIRQPT